MIKVQNKKYDLEERTIEFSKNIINLCNKIDRNPVNNPLITQLVRPATSIGANYSEANGASSKKDFKNKISICKKEAKETKYWLTLITSSDFHIRGDLKLLWSEAQELTLIFSKIFLNTN
jgi:four helix bundle protein